MRWTENVAHTGKIRTEYNILIGKHGGKRSFRRPRRTCMDNIKMDLRKIGLECVGRIRLTQERNRWRIFVNTVMNLHKRRGFFGQHGS
jgi:hypothetical protein